MYKLKNKKGHNKATIREMLSLYEQGYTMQAIGDSYGITRQAVCYYLKLAGASKKKTGPKANVVRL